MRLSDQNLMRPSCVLLSSRGPETRAEARQRAFPLARQRPVATFLFRFGCARNQQDRPSLSSCTPALRFGCARNQQGRSGGARKDSNGLVAGLAPAPKRAPFALGHWDVVARPRKCTHASSSRPLASRRFLRISGGPCLLVWLFVSHLSVRVLPSRLLLPALLSSE
jgi:hypothetical protein